jgi:transcriptional regulator with XRE-family HTH domain
VKLNIQDVANDIAKKLHDERIRQGLSMYRLAAKSGLSQQAIGYLERGIRVPSLETLLRISIALNFDLGKLLRQVCKKYKSDTS